MTRKHSEHGFALIEMLVVMLLFSIMGLSLAFSNMTALETRGRTEIQAAALQVAAEMMEDYAAVDPINLSEVNDITDTVTHNGFEFSREGTVAVNADTSRTVVVRVTSENARYGGNFQLRSTFALWGAL